MDIIEGKVAQVAGLLKENHMDMWLIAVRETDVMADPVLPLVVGHDVVWESFFMFTADGQATAIVGNFDQEDFKRCGYFSEVIPYTEGVAAVFAETIARHNPGRIGINYSPDNPSADGLTHGMYLKLCKFLAGTPYVERLVSAAEVCSRLRSRKSPDEIACLTTAAEMAVRTWDNFVSKVKPGLTEKKMAAMIDAEIGEMGAVTSFETIVNAGSKTQPGHGNPTDAVCETGELLHIDFGVRHEEYCSDIQRLVYFRKPREKTAPHELTKAFETVRDIITETAHAAKPGATGLEVDTLARRLLTDRGHPEYQHALGHQLGRNVHDGGALIGPRWERYGNSPLVPLEASNAFTLELEIRLDGIGCVGLEEDIIITHDGGRFISPRQTELVVI